MTYDTINDAVTIAGCEGTIPVEKGTTMDKSIGDAVTMKPKEERGGRGAFTPGDIIAGRYVVERTLGEGGMGIVYQCLDRVGGVKVAVKCLPPEVGRNAEEMEDIRANYRLVADLHHPNIAGARTLELDESTGDYYLVMDLARGTGLKRWMRRNPQTTTGTKLAILRQVAAALDYAHSRKVLHRDVKPENVMVDDDGGVKVLDFGLAAQIRSSQSRTSAAVTSRSGTPGYKSPEQWRGRPQGASSDVYSFGVLAYWMLADELPFDGDDMVVLGHAVLTETVEPIADLPDYMNAALAKALAKKPDERFASCGALVDALEGRRAAPQGSITQVGNGAQVGGSQGGRAVSMKPPQGGPRSVAAMKGILAAALLAALAGGAWWWATTGTTGTHGVVVERRRQAEEAAAKAKAEQERERAEAEARERAERDARERERLAKESVNPQHGETRTLTLPGGATMEMIYVAPGTFTMGSPESEDGRFDTETQHRVTLTKGYWLGKYEVTQRQWMSVMGDNPSFFKGDDRPVECVSWGDCQRFMSKVDAAARRQFGGGARLPTEAEWEYACRAETTTAYFWGNALNGDRANCNDNYPCGTTTKGQFNQQTTTVGSYPANPWGFHDMHGNVREWCNDRYGSYNGDAIDPQGPASGVDRVLRGGDWGVYARYCRSAFRYCSHPGLRDSYFGFRLCCSAGPRGEEAER